MTHRTYTTRDSLAGSSRLRLSGYLLAFLALPFFAVWAVIYGKEAGWDFQNYHWYDPYSLLSGRLGFDIAVAHHATYYNPFLDVPLYWVATHFPAWTGGALLGAEAGVAAALIGAIAYRLLPFENTRQRMAVAVLLALSAMTGGGAAGEIGKTSDDIAAGLGAIAGLFVLIACFDRVVRAKGADLLFIALAGFLAGGSPGLKLTSLPYVVGMTLGVLALPGGFWLRILRTGVFGIGVLIGIAVFGGAWFWTIWQYSGNPVFPYFNDLFHSPLVPPGSYRDETFLPKDWSTRLFFPFIFSQNSLTVAEWSFRDLHILIAYILVPVAALAALFRKPVGRRLVDPLMARLMLVMAVGTYVVWIFLFGIYRYLIPLEMLSGLVIVSAAAMLPLRSGVRLAIMVVLLGGAQVMAWKGEEPRFSWQGPYVGVTVPPIADPANTLILMTENAPMAYVIPAFPKEIPFLRIQGWMIGSKDTSSMLGAEMHRRVAEHKGPILGLYWPVEHEATVGAFADYGLKLDDAACKPVESNIQEPIDQGHPLLLCPLIRMTP
ncbi:MAG: hypothetical protein JWM91_5219 [Rhodospirillales bacterium]|nr:hypothetical protein [Rhodospirillales bacterium]